MASGVQMSKQADTAPVCSTPEYCNWVEFLWKWTEHLRGDAFWKLQKIDTSHIMKISILRPCLQLIESGFEMSTEADTAPVCSMLKYFTWVEFPGKWSQYWRGHAFWKWPKFDVSHNCLIFDFCDHVCRSWQVVYKWLQKVILHQFVVPQSTSIEWSLSENEQSTYAEMHFENCKKSTSPIMEILILRPCLQVIASVVEMSTDADTLPVWSMLEYLLWVEFHRKRT